MGLRADPGDVESSHDYAGFSRQPGFVITDYDEDNPASFDFPVARPLPIDSAHLEMAHVQGHRYVIRYEIAPGNSPPTVLQTQRYYEKLAAATGFNLEKSGAVGDVTETFVQQKDNRFVWVYLEPGVSTYALTIMESGDAPPPAAHPTLPPSVIAQTPVPAVTPPPAPTPAPVPVVATPTPAPSSPAPPSKPAAMPTPKVVETPAPNPEPKPESTKATSSVPEDPLYTALMNNGHVRIPIAFSPGKTEVDADSQPVINRVIAMLKLHPDLEVEIDGHTDNYGSAAENRYMSSQRAQNVRQKLIDGHIKKWRLTAVGKGGAQPIADNDTEEGRARNRRIELVVAGDSVRKKAAPKKAPSTSSAQDDSASNEAAPFHPNAPNGMNYYPSSTGPSDNPDASR